MKLLDRYLLRQFVQIFVICFLSLMGLYLVIDLFGHLDNFSEQAKREGSLLKVIAKYYGYQSLGFFDRTSGILAMIAAMFTVTWLQRHQEMTAMLAAGISKFRIVRPLVIAAVVVSLISMASREFLLPQIREELTRTTKDLGGTEARALEARFDGQTDILIGGEQTIALQRKIVKPTFVMPRALKQYGNQLVAREAVYLDATDQHPAGYLMNDVTAPTRIDQRNSLRLRDREVVMTAREQAWLQPGQVFVVSQLPFELLASGAAWRNYASTRELIEELNSPSTDLGADVRVAVHTRMVQPVIDTTLLMLGLPLMFSRRQRNVFLSIGICLSVAIAFALATIVCQSLGGVSLLRPTLAAWLPIMVFLPIAVGMSHTLRT
ncbi:MAG: LptF/LptG family permease [Planctomycetota bacterium]